MDSWGKRSRNIYQISIVSLPILSLLISLAKKDASFLDLKTSLSKGKLSTDLHMKPTDYQQYLHYSSGHPEHTKRSTVYGQSLRGSRIFSRENVFNWHDLT